MGVDYTTQYKREQLEPFFPNEIVKMGIVVLCTLAILVLLVIFPTLLEEVGLTGVFHEEEPANPKVTPHHIKPEWYFLATYQYLKLMPQEFLGMDGKALGIFTQAIGMLLLIALPFWFPLSPTPLRGRGAGGALAAYLLMVFIFVCGAFASAMIRAKLEEPYSEIFHPIFAWPALAIFSFVLAWLWARKHIEYAFEWLKLLVSGTFLLGFQFVVWIVVLAQALSPVLGKNVAYPIAFILLSLASLLTAWFLFLRSRGQDKHLRWPALVAFVTEWLLLFLGLTLWAMWPAEGLFGEEGLTAEGRSFLFSASVIAIAVVIFYSLILTERRAIGRVLGIPSKGERDNES